MKFSVCSAAVIGSLFLSTAAPVVLAQANKVQGNNFRNFNDGQRGKNAQAGKGSSVVASSSSVAQGKAAVVTPAPANNLKGNGNKKGDTATTTAAAAAASVSLVTGFNKQFNSGQTLDKSVLCTNCTNDGSAAATNGQALSSTSNDNYINFCKGQTITNGVQNKAGSCNPVPMGQIPSFDNMPSGKFTNPKNLDKIQANQDFTITKAVKNMQFGVFTNAQTTYYMAPQQLNAQGQIFGHDHFLIEAIDSITSTTVTNPQKFAFFKGVDGAAVNGVLSVTVKGGLPDGFYRMCSIMASSNHQPVLMPVAQHGSVDDCVYFTAGNGNGNAAQVDADSVAKQSFLAAQAAKTAAPAAPAASSSAANTGNAGGNKTGNNNKNNGGNNRGKGRQQRSRGRHSGRRHHRHHHMMD